MRQNLKSVKLASSQIESGSTDRCLQKHVIYFWKKKLYFFFSIIFNIPRFFELYTEMDTKNSTIFNETLGENVTIEVTVPIVSPTELRKNSDYSRDYVLITNSVALGFIPMVGLVVLNSLIFRTINQATQRHNAISSNQRRDHSVSIVF